MPAASPADLGTRGRRGPRPAPPMHGPRPLAACWRRRLRRWRPPCPTRRRQAVPGAAAMRHGAGPAACRHAAAAASLAAALAGAPAASGWPGSGAPGAAHGRAAAVAAERAANDWQRRSSCASLMKWRLTCRAAREGGSARPQEPRASRGPWGLVWLPPQCRSQWLAARQGLAVDSSAIDVRRDAASAAVGPAGRRRLAGGKSFVPGGLPPAASAARRTQAQPVPHSSPTSPRAVSPPMACRIPHSSRLMGRPVAIPPPPIADGPQACGKQPGAEAPCIHLVHPRAA